MVSARLEAEWEEGKQSRSLPSCRTTSCKAPRSSTGSKRGAGTAGKVGGGWARPPVAGAACLR